MNDAFAALAAAYLDGSLDEAQSERLLAYLHESPAAAEHLRATAAIDSGLRQLAAHGSTAQDFRRSVLARIQAHGSSRPFRAAVERRIAEAQASSGKPQRIQRRRGQRSLMPTLMGAAAAVVVAVVLAFAVLWLRPPERSMHPDAMAMVEAADGWVTIERGDQTETAVTGSALAAGDIVVTAEKATAEVRLSDGTRFHLGPSAALQLAAGDGARARLQHGEVEAEVAPQAADAPAILSTANAIIHVLGTRFTVAAESDLTSIHVSSGLVRLSATADSTVANPAHATREWRIGAGESLTLTHQRAERTQVLELRRRPDQPWRAANARTLATLTSFSPPSALPALDAWGGRLDHMLKPSGAFHIEQGAGRWWMVDPDGHPVVLAGIDNIHHTVGGGDDPQLIARFGDLAGWARETTSLISANGFNLIGSESDHQVLTAAVQGRSDRPGSLYNAEIATSFTKAFLATRAQLAADAGTRKLVQFLAPLLPGFAKSVSAWERRAPDLLAHGEAVGVVTDRFACGDFSWTRLRRLAALDPTLRATLDGWLAGHQATLASAGPAELSALRRACLTGYRDVVFAAVHKAAPRLLLFGEILGASLPADGEIADILAAPCDVVAVSMISAWLEDAHSLVRISRRCGRPLFIEGFYAKGVDAGLPDIDGTGLEVATQTDRGRFYQHLVLAALEARVCVGWSWFRYEDLGDSPPTHTVADYNSNKGIVDSHFKPYRDLLRGMAEVNRLRYALIDYFDGVLTPAP
jgi:ferric-dicitrate binding protein FerR (iron transport regulator)